MNFAGLRSFDIFAVLILIFLFAVPSFAESTYYITSPTEKSSWRVGESKTISWNITDWMNVPNEIDVDLMAGEEDNLSKVTEICGQISGRSNSCRWNQIPVYLPSGRYSIRVDHRNGRDYSYSSWFNIAGNFKIENGKVPTAPEPYQCVGDCQGKTLVDNNPVERVTDQRSVMDISNSRKSFTFTEYYIALAVVLFVSFRFF